MGLRISGGQKNAFFPRNSIESHGTPIKTVTSLKYIYMYIYYLLDNIYHVGTRGRDKSGGQRSSAFENIIVARGGVVGRGGRKKNCVIYVLSV